MKVIHQTILMLCTLSVASMTTCSGVTRTGKTESLSRDTPGISAKEIDHRAQQAAAHQASKISYSDYQKHVHRLNEAAKSIAEQIAAQEARRKDEDQQIAIYKSVRESENITILKYISRINTMSPQDPRKRQIVDMLKTRLQQDAQVQDIISRRDYENIDFIATIKELSRHADNIKTIYTEQNPGMKVPAKLALHFNQIKNLEPAIAMQKIAEAVNRALAAQAQERS